MNTTDPNETPGEGVTLIYAIHVPKGHGPDYKARFWGHNESEAQAKADAYCAKLPRGHTPAPLLAVERRLGH